MATDLEQQARELARDAMLRCQLDEPEQNMRVIESALREAMRLQREAILAEYPDELNKAACDRCEECGPEGTAMCSFHSLLSYVQGNTAGLDGQHLRPAIRAGGPNGR